MHKQSWVWRFVFIILLVPGSSLAECIDAPSGYISIETPEQFYRTIRDGYTGIDEFGTVHNTHSYFICNDLDFSGFNYDLPIAYTGTTRIEQAFVPFDGSFRGRVVGASSRPQIRNLLLNNQAAGHSGLFYALFSELHNAEIANLSFEDFSVSGRSIVALLAGQTSGDTQIRNIDLISRHLDSNVRAIHGTQGQNGDYASLLVGHSFPSSHNVLLLDNINVYPAVPAGSASRIVSVQALRGPAAGLIAKLFGGKLRSIQTDSLNVTGVMNAGGIVAIVAPSTDAATTMLEDVHFYGQVHSAHDNYSPRNPCGVAQSSILGCGNAGGVLGLSSGTLRIHRASALGRVTGFNYVAGLLGRFDTSSSIDANNTEIRNSFSQAELAQLTISPLDPPTSAGGVAGLVGYLRGTVRSSYSAAPLMETNGVASMAGLILQNGNSTAVMPIDTQSPSYFDHDRTPIADNGMGVGVSTQALQTGAGAIFTAWDPSIWYTATGAYPSFRPFVSFSCPADMDGNMEVTLQDLFDFINAWFMALPAADINQDGSITLQDLFDYLTHWFARC